MDENQGPNISQNQNLHSLEMVILEFSNLPKRTEVFFSKGLVIHHWHQVSSLRWDVLFPFRRTSWISPVTTSSDWCRSYCCCGGKWLKILHILYFLRPGICSSDSAVDSFLLSRCLKHLHFAAPSTKRLFESCALYFHPVAEIIETYRNHIAEIRNVWRIQVVLIDACAIEECINMHVK